MKTMNNSDVSFLRLAVAVATMRGAAVLGFSGNACFDKGMVPCMNYEDIGFDNCNHCTHISTEKYPDVAVKMGLKMEWDKDGMQFDKCDHVDSVEYREESKGYKKADCFWNAEKHICMNSNYDMCFMQYYTMFEMPVSKTAKIPWSNGNVKGVSEAQYTEERSAPGEFGEALRKAGANRGLSIKSTTTCENCSIPCVFEPTTALWSIQPDPYGNVNYGRGQKAEEFYNYVGPKVAGARTVFVKLGGHKGCAASEMPAAKLDVEWKGTTYTFTPLATAGTTKIDTCATTASRVCGTKILRKDNTRCSGDAHCEQACCDCPADSTYYGRWCPFWRNVGYCDHTFVNWMQQYCAGTCCKRSS